jgi:hypothetical protein
MTTSELKEALKLAGFEVYRVRGDDVQLAERVRENLILDSGISVRRDTWIVRVVLRVERMHFPGAPDEALFGEAGLLALPFVSDGFRETERRAMPVTDPMNAERVLDTFFEVVVERAAASLAEAVDLCRVAFGRERIKRPA